MVFGRRLLKLAVAAFVATAALCPSIEARAGETEPLVIEIRSFEFGPERPTVAVGDVVIWRNLDIVPHTVTARGDSWDSGSIEAGGEWKMVVTEAMVGDYYCRFHPAMIASLNIQRP